MRIEQLGAMGALSSADAMGGAAAGVATDDSSYGGLRAEPRNYANFTDADANLSLVAKLNSEWAEKCNEDQRRSILESAASARAAAANAIQAATIRLAGSLGGAVFQLGGGAMGMRASGKLSGMTSRLHEGRREKILQQARNHTTLWGGAGSAAQSLGGIAGYSDAARMSDEASKSMQDAYGGLSGSTRQGALSQLAEMANFRKTIFAAENQTLQAIVGR